MATSRFNTKVAPLKDASSPGYPPNRQEGPSDASRRRFLRQIVVGSSALGVLPGASLARAQGPEVDYSVLGEHETTATGDSTESARTDEQSSAAEPARRARRRGAQRSETETASAPDETVENASEESAETVTWITEHRALWVEPGYLLLLEWSRPELDEAPIAGLEAMSGAVSAHLAEQVSDPVALHDTDRLFQLEQTIVALLTPAVSPAQIDVIHLDHDCNAVCGALEVRPTGPAVRGRIRSPRY